MADNSSKPGMKNRSRHLLLVSNRLPITIEKKKGQYIYRQSVGGLATGLASFYKTYDSLWLGWCGLASNNIDSRQRRVIEQKLREHYKSQAIFLTKNDQKLFYSGFCNKTIWPLFHYFPEYVVYHREQWESYKHVNRIFFQALKKVAGPEDIIWIHDYHLMLLPQMIREKLPRTHIGFFLHIPFPSYEIFRQLPWRQEILKGLLGADLIGFHTFDYVRHFMSSVRRILGYEHTFGQITTENRLVQVDAFPMGIHYDRFAGAETADTEWIHSLENMCKDECKGKVILSVDRMDYTKGIPQRLEAYDYFLDKYPEYKKCVTLVMIAVPSRTGVETYQRLKHQVDELVGRINGKHGTINWMPVWYFYRYMPFDHLAALYNLADVALVTPLRDGMNLIAKEYVASKKEHNGVLILSEMAGAVSELAEAIAVNPNNKDEVADAIEEALRMDPKEQADRMQVMKQRIRRYDIVAWTEDFMNRLSHTKNVQSEIGSRRLTPVTKNRLGKIYCKSKKRLIFLDYDGTLVPFVKRPELAVPDRDIRSLLARLSSDSGNEVMIVSGRDRDTLIRWFGDLNVGLSAEHGVWIRNRGKEWDMLEKIQDTWKKDIRPIVEKFVDRTPGSFIEEKSFSLAWHYRKVDPGLGPLRANEMKDTLHGMTTNLNLVILEGNNVIEIKNGGINKGRAATYWTTAHASDFILAIGDDWTDEDLFEALPDSAYTIKVGLGITKARYYLTSHHEVRELLHHLVESA